jgi:hypothetical protein
MFVRHDSMQELPGAPQHAPFPTAPLRVACLPEYFMYCNYLKRLGTRQTKHLYLLQVSGPHFNILARRYGYANTCFFLGELTAEC